MAVAWLKTGKPDIGLTINGGLAGLVAITAGCAFVTPLNSIAIGAIGGVIAVYGVSFLDKVRVDDPVGAVPVHAFAGVWGTLAVGLFHETGGLLYGAGWSQLGVQAIGVAAVFAWAAVTVGGVFIIIKYTIGLRVSYEEEIMGLDRGEHAVDSYPDFEVSASRARAAR